MSEARASARRRQLYGRQKGPGLRARQSALLESLLPQISVDIASGALSNPASLFDPNTREVWLEIGFGGGEHLAAQARAHPEIGFIGCEPFVNGVAKLLVAIEADGLANIRIHPGDARNVMDALGDQTIARVFLLHPDPWPKRRHHKRRFVNQENLGVLHRIIQPNGLFELASDSPDYIDWSLREIRAHGRFQLEGKATEGLGTRYGAKASAAGRETVYLTFRRPG